jgi:N-methylhydantoinase A
VLVPARPGITNALGCVVADLRHDYVRTDEQVRSPRAGRRTRCPAYPAEAQIGRGPRPRSTREGVAVRELRSRCCTRPTCSSRARATS